MKKSLFSYKRVLSALLAGALMCCSFLSVNAVDATESTTEAEVVIKNGSRYNGAAEFNFDTKNTAQAFSSSESYQNALLIGGGTSTFTDATITKSGDADDEAADYYGTNAAVLAYSSASVSINGGSVSTDGNRADGIFAYGYTASINLSNTSIITAGDNSGGITASNGSTVNVKKATVSTTGSSSPALKSNKSDSSLLVDGGTYSTSGASSPVVFTDNYVSVSNANLTSTASEGVFIDGAGSIQLKKSTLTDTNSVPSNDTEVCKNIYIYRTENFDSQDSSNFTADDSKIITNKGDTFFVENASTEINLSGNIIINTDGDFLRVRADGAEKQSVVSLNMSDQKIDGGIILDEDSVLNVFMNNASEFIGSVNSGNNAKKITLDLSKDSVISLTADSYVDFLTNEDTENSNIYLNGHKLYVNGKAVNGNTSTYGEVETTQAVEATISTESTQAATEPKPADNENKDMIYIAVGIAAAILVVLIIASVMVYKKKLYKSKEDLNSEASTPNQDDTTE